MVFRILGLALVQAQPLVVEAHSPGLGSDRPEASAPVRADELRSQGEGLACWRPGTGTPVQRPEYSRADSDSDRPALNDQAGVRILGGASHHVHTYAFAQAGKEFGISFGADPITTAISLRSVSVISARLPVYRLPST